MASSPKFFDRVQESSSTTGTGTYTLAGAVTGFQTFAAVGDGNSCIYCATEVDGNGNPSGAWEINIGTYTAAGTTLTRDTLRASSTGSAISWAAGTRRLFLVSDALMATPDLSAGGRLTTESGVPISTSDRTAQGTIYYTPFVHNRVALWDGSGWRRYTFTERSLALTVTSGKNYDVFLYDNAGTLTLELSAAWTTDTARADALTTQDGITCKSGALTRRWLGTIRASGANTIEDSVTKRYVWNQDNAVRCYLYKNFAANHAYNSATIRGWNASTTTGRVEAVFGAANRLTQWRWTWGTTTSSAAAGYTVGLGRDTSTANTSGIGRRVGTSVIYASQVESWPEYSPLGYHYYQITEATDGNIDFGESVFWMQGELWM